MNLEEIKVGETVNVKLHIRKIEPDNSKLWIAEADEGGIIKLTFAGAYISTGHILFSEDFITTAPKYDPCRKFRKGDKVQVKKRDGRCNGKDGEYLREAFCTVFEDETQNELVRVLHNATEYRLDPAYLELVTPVEELEPYSVKDSSDRYMVVDEKGAVIVMFYKARHPHAKAAAEAECDRLNAEYRKEQE